VSSFVYPLYIFKPNLFSVIILNSQTKNNMSLDNNVTAATNENELIPSAVDTKVAVAKSKRKSVKKGHGRPFARLPQTTLEMRMTKLKKRIEKSRSTLTSAEGYLRKYTREYDLRKSNTVVMDNTDENTVDKTATA
jgi:hypothetical protein